MLSDYYPPHTGGGVERVASELCRGLVSRGHEVTMLTLRTDPAPSVESNGNLVIRRVPAVDLTRRLGFQFAVSAHVFPSTIRLLRRFKPDVVHAHNLFFRTTEVATFLSLLSRLPLVTTVHLGSFEGDRSWLKSAVRLYEGTLGRLVLTRSRHVIAVSSAVAEHVRRLGRGSRPMSVIPNGVDTELFHPADEHDGQTKTVLFVGRLVPNKGPETLLRAAPGVLGRRPDARFLFVGDGPLEHSLKSLSRDLDVESRVSFLGVRHDVPDLMRQAAVLARPSTLEGMPLTVLEAMASALPVVATPVGGTPELVIDGENGFLVQPNDTEALASRLTDLLDDAAAAREMGLRGRKRVLAEHTWAQVVEQTEDVYARVAAG